MSPLDFDLFPKLKINMRGLRFSTLEDLSASGTRSVKQLKCSTDLTGYHGPSKTLGCSHSTEEGLHWRSITLSRTSDVLFCRYCILCISFEMAFVYWSSCTVPLFLSNIKDTWNNSTYVQKYSNAKFHKNPSSRFRVVPCWQTTGQTGSQT